MHLVTFIHRSGWPVTRFGGVKSTDLRFVCLAIQSKGAVFSRNFWWLFRLEWARRLPQCRPWRNDELLGAPEL